MTISRTDLIDALDLALTGDDGYPVAPGDVLMLVAVQLGRIADALERMTGEAS